MASERRSLTLEDFWSLRTVSDMRVSPDGAAVAYVVQSMDEEKNSAASAIWLVSLADGHERRFTAGEAMDMQPRWSPDGKRLAFVSARHEGKPQIFLIERDGGEPKRLTSMEHGAAAPVWSPDGTHLIVTVEAPSDRQKTPLETAWYEAHAKAEKGPLLRRQTDLQVRHDGRGFIEKRAQLYVIAVDAEGAEPTQLTEGDYDHQEAAWSPDGSAIAFIANRGPNPDRRLGSDIWTMDPSGGNLTRLTNGDLMVLSLAWSPDSRRIAFYAGADFAQHKPDEPHVWLVSREGSDQRDLSAPQDRAVLGVQPDYCWVAASMLAWSRDGGTLYHTAVDRGDTAIYALGAGGGESRRITQGPIHTCGFEVTPDGAQLVLLAATPTQPFDLFTVPTSGGEPRPLTRTNQALLDQITMAPTACVTFHGADGWEIEGWLVTPADGGESTPYPLILQVHGGPYGAWGNSFYFQAQALAGLGYASLYVNPRGSYGYGAAFSRPADWGVGDFQDLMAGVDALIVRGDADPARLGITGISYGGFMTNWAIGHTDRFKGAVSVNGVASMFSMYGVSDITAQWFGTEMGGPYWTSEEQWALYRRRSPLSHVGHINTPVLFLQSENDYRCPIIEGEQMFTALQMRGQTTELVRFPGASHVMVVSASPLHRYMQWKLAEEWFERYVRG